MGKVGYADLSKYGTQSGSNYFKLEDDGDTARVRFLFKNLDDVAYAVHDVKEGDKYRTVNCLRDYNSPIDDCPFCAARVAQKVKLYIPIYDVESGTVKVWQRPKSFMKKLSSVHARFNPIYETEFEIERNGKKGDMQTTYEIYPIGHADSSEMTDYPEVPDIIGTFVLDKSVSDMDYFLESGEFPPEDAPQAPRRGERRETPLAEEQFRRRTPSRTNKEVF